MDATAGFAKPTEIACRSRGETAREVTCVSNRNVWFFLSSASSIAGPGAGFFAGITVSLVPGASRADPVFALKASREEFAGGFSRNGSLSSVSRGRPWIGDLKSSSFEVPRARLGIVVSVPFRLRPVPKLSS